MRDFKLKFSRYYSGDDQELGFEGRWLQSLIWNDRCIVTEIQHFYWYYLFRTEGNKRKVQLVQNILYRYYKHLFN